MCVALYTDMANNNILFATKLLSMRASTSLIDIVNLLLRKGLELEGEGGSRVVARGNLLSVIKVIDGPL